MKKKTKKIKRNPTNKKPIPHNDIWDKVMAGNKFWQLRSKHGRDRLFKTPKLLYDACCEYFEWCDDNPLMEAQIHGKEPEQFNLPKMRPYTIQGLTCYLRCNIQYFNEFEESLIGKKDKLSLDFSAIITHIRQIIYNQKFTGAAAGFFNANVISRDLGLVDKIDVDAKVNKKTVDQIFPPETELD